MPARNRVSTGEPGVARSALSPDGPDCVTCRRVLDLLLLRALVVLQSPRFAGSVMSYASLLFAPSGFLTGLSSVLDFGGTLSEFNSCLSDEQADRLALQSDWASVSHDLWAAHECVGQDMQGVAVVPTQETAPETTR